MSRYSKFLHCEPNKKLRDYYNNGAPHHNIRWQAFEGILTGMQDGIANSKR